MEIAYLSENISIPTIKKIKKIDCKCENCHLNNKNKCFSICDVCSENNFLRKSSKKIIFSNSFL